MYPNNPDPIQTYGVLATVVTSAKTPDAVVLEVVRAVFETRRVQEAAPGAREPEAGGHDHAGPVAPLHPAAATYYRQRGLLK